LGSFPFEQDEFYTIMESTDLFHTTLQPGISARPFYYLVEHPLVTILPHTPAMLRLLPLLFGIAGVVVMWHLGRWVLGRAGGIVAALLTTISPWHLYISGMARYWSLVFLLAAATYWLLPRAYDSDRPRDYVIALIVLLIGTATHPSFVFPVAGAIVGLSLVRADGRFGLRWPSANAWRLLWGPFLLLAAVGVVALKLSGKAGALQNWSGRGTLAVLRLAPAMIEWMTVPMAIGGAVGALLMLGSPQLRERRFAAMTLIGAPSAVILLVFEALRTNVYADYGVAMLPLVFVSAAAIPQYVWQASRRGMLLAGGVTALLAVSVLPSTASHLSDGMRFDYRPAYGRIQQDAPQLLVVTSPIVEQVNYGPGLRAMELTSDATVLDSVLTREHEIWMVISAKRTGWVGDDGHRLQPWVIEHCREVQSNERPRLDYRYYRVELYRCRAG